jgi:cytoskeletal protein CcmA (bactofilin family)
MKKRENQMNAFLGSDPEFEGRLSFSGAVRIDGAFKGEIVSEGTLIVGETARMASEIDVAHIIISGEVHGNITAQKRLEVRAPGRIIGNIQSPTITIDEGVVFEGQCRMEKHDEGAEGDTKGTVLAGPAVSDNEN